MNNVSTCVHVTYRMSLCMCLSVCMCVVFTHNILLTFYICTLLEYDFSNNEFGLPETPLHNSIFVLFPDPCLLYTISNL